MDAKRHGRKFIRYGRSGIDMGGMDLPFQHHAHSRAQGRHIHPLHVFPVEPREHQVGLADHGERIRGVIGDAPALQIGGGLDTRIAPHAETESRVLGKVNNTHRLRTPLQG